MGRSITLWAVSALAATTTTGPCAALAFNVNPRVTTTTTTTTTVAAHGTHATTIPATPPKRNNKNNNPSSMCYRNGNVNIISVGRRHSPINTHHQAVCGRHKQPGQGVMGGMQESAWIGSSSSSSSSPSIFCTTSGSAGLAARQQAGQERKRRRAGTAGLQQGGVVSMTFGSRLNYEKDYFGPRLWPKHPIDQNRDWNKCKEMVELGGGLKVSKVGIGCVTFGGQLDDIDDVAEVLDHAFDRAGINWLDTSETFPHPFCPRHKFKADPLIGEWLATRDRSKVILATKVAGHSEQCNWLRKDGSITMLNRDQIMESVEGSLKRLGTDYIDILHVGEWPERLQTGYSDLHYRTVDEHEHASDIKEQLMTVQELVDQGLVRHVAVSNENAYGVTKFCEHADWDNLPRIVSVQAQYNVVTQVKVERGLLEACSPINENVPIIATMPLAGGALTGKYINEIPQFRNERWRLNKYHGWQARFDNEKINGIYNRYAAIAARYDMTLHQLAIAFVNTRPFIRAMIMGATSPEQIDQNMACLDLTIPDECVKEIISLQDEVIEPTLGKSTIKSRFHSRQSPRVLQEYSTITPPMLRGDLPMDPSLPKEPDYPRGFSQYIKEENFHFIPDVPEEGGAPVAVSPHPDEWA